MAGSHCQGVGVGVSVETWEGAKMETWQPEPASLAAGPRPLLLDGGARGLQGSEHVGIRTDNCKVRTG